MTVSEELSGPCLYQKEKRTKYEQFRTLRFALGYLAIINDIVLRDYIMSQVGFFSNFYLVQICIHKFAPQLLSICIRFLR